LASARNYRGEGSIEGWCDRIVVRTVLRMARRQDRSQKAIDRSEDPETLPHPSAGLEPEALAADVTRYLDELPEARRMALILRHGLDYSVDEIAELTGVSRNTVKDRLLAAREQLRRLVRREQTVAQVRRQTA
jgi:RNA polymerase sigma-70 factor (ECF subfamily)